MQLRVLGIKPHKVSLDDYFINRGARNQHHPHIRHTVVNLVCDLRNLLFVQRFIDADEVAKELDGFYDYFYGYMPLSTGVLKVFALELYSNGFLIRFPNPDAFTSTRETPLWYTRIPSPSLRL